jgi:hypothetical protein
MNQYEWGTDAPTTCARRLNAEQDVRSQFDERLTFDPSNVAPIERHAGSVGPETNPPRIERKLALATGTQTA